MLFSFLKRGSHWFVLKSLTYSFRGCQWRLFSRRLEIRLIHASLTSVHEQFKCQTKTKTGESSYFQTVWNFIDPNHWLQQKPQGKSTKETSNTYNFINVSIVCRVSWTWGEKGGVMHQHAHPPLSSGRRVSGVLSRVPHPIWPGWSERSVPTCE